MLENLKRYNVILASHSPRRKELLTRLGVSFKVRTLLGIDERYPSSLRAEEIAEYVSRKKSWENPVMLKKPQQLYENFPVELTKLLLE